MLLAPGLGAPPREIAARLGERLSERLGAAVDHVEVAGPGFLNVFLADHWYVAAARQVFAAGEDWGRGAPARPEKVIVEYVSANPTGPLTAASGRHAAYGDAIARLLEFAGHEVVREYYFNDTGSQITALGASVRARARGEPPPEDGYRGDYVGELAARIPDAAERRPRRARRQGGGADHGEHPRDARGLPRRVRLLLPRGLAARRRSVADRRRLRAPARGRAALRVRRRAVAAHDDVRRRQGSRARALERCADLLRRRRRLPREQGPARVRPHDRRARRRPPRLHPAHEGRDGRARRATPTDSRSRVLQFVHIVEGGEPREDVQASRRFRDA